MGDLVHLSQAAQAVYARHERLAVHNPVYREKISAKAPPATSAAVAKLILPPRPSVFGKWFEVSTQMCGMAPTQSPGSGKGKAQEQTMPSMIEWAQASNNMLIGLALVVSRLQTSAWEQLLTVSMSEHGLK